MGPKFVWEINHKESQSFRTCTTVSLHLQLVRSYLTDTLVATKERKSGNPRRRGGKGDGRKIENKKRT